MRKRRKSPMPMKEGRLSASWGYTKAQNTEDIYYTNGPGTARADAHLLHYFFDCAVEGNNKRNLLDELKVRGYDLTTLRFSVDKMTDKGT